jgi:DNA recombination protein RmuC
MTTTFIAFSLLNILVLLIVFLLFKKSLKGSLELSMAKLQNENLGQVSKMQYEFSDKLTGSLDSGLSKTQKTLETVIEKVSKVDSASVHVKELASQVLKLQSILTDKKSRGNFGEAILENLLKNVFGPQSDDSYKLQYKFNTGSIADAVLSTNGELFAIDSKFPLENFVRLNESTDAGTDFSVEFRKNIKKHIDDISSKYIISGETLNQAIMFIPSEAIFTEIYHNHSELVDYSWKKKVWLASPTTLLSILNSILLMMQQKKRDEKTELIHQELLLLASDFSRFQERWEKTHARLKSAHSEMDNLSITADKITRKFEKISTADI